MPRIGDSDVGTFNGRDKTTEVHNEETTNITRRVRQTTEKTEKTTLQEKKEQEKSLLQKAEVASLPPSPRSSSTDSDACICHRPLQLVICSLCSTNFIGHAALKCSKHPRNINLMDVRNCPNKECRSDLLVEVPL
ncbi:hypothetical protein AB6A40_008014 [Gnathostoma spinigerum]|uniref:Uncharacterized protein n=1 Tax=Gnathostoma spinigerum TaxID=75299 RepID=A0ABD6EMV7_9BILA